MFKKLKQKIELEGSPGGVTSTPTAKDATGDVTSPGTASSPADAHPPSSESKGVNHIFQIDQCYLYCCQFFCKK